MNSSVIPIFVTYHLGVDKFIKLNKLWNNVIFVDNSGIKSTDIKLQKLDIIWNQMNLGYGGGADIGIKHALSLGADWVIIMNQDLKITKKAFEGFVRELNRANPAIIGPFAGSLDKKRWTTVLPSNQVDYISGGCMAIHRDVIKKVGDFYQPFFMYYEDVDYCIRAKKSGFPLKSLANSGICHDDSPSLGKGSFLHEYYLSRNHLLFVERQAPFLIKLHELFRIPKSYIEHYYKQNVGGASGFNDYFMRRFGNKL